MVFARDFVDAAIVYLEDHDFKFLNRSPQGNSVADNFIQLRCVWSLVSRQLPILLLPVHDPSTGKSGDFVIIRSCFLLSPLPLSLPLPPSTLLLTIGSSAQGGRTRFTVRSKRTLTRGMFEGGTPL